MCKTVPSTVSAAYRRSHTEGLTEEFMEDGGHGLCHVEQKELGYKGKNGEVREVRMQSSAKTCLDGTD